MQQFKTFASSLTWVTTSMISTLRQSRNLSKNILFKILHALECIFIHIIKSRINILCYWKKKPEKMDEWPWKCQDLLESILCLMTPLHHILLYSPLREFDAPLFSPNQNHHCYLKTALQNLWKLMPWKLIKLLHVTVFNLFQLCS